MSSFEHLGRSGGRPRFLVSPTLTVPTATVGGELAELLFSGLAPTFVGLYQVNLIVPAATPAGAVDLTLTQDVVASNVVELMVGGGSQ